MSVVDVRAEFSVCAVIAAALAAAGPALAAEKVEITPFVGVRAGGELLDEAAGRTVALGGAPDFGVVVDLGLFPEGSLEVLLSRQIADVSVEDEAGARREVDLAVDYVHVGATHEWGRPKSRSFVAVTLGITRFDARGTSFRDPIGLSGSIGGGGKFMLGRRLGLRVEGRGYGTVVSSSAGASCGGEGCRVRFTGSGWWQLEANVGLIVRF